LPMLASNCSPPNHSPQVARLIGVSHLAWLDPRSPVYDLLSFLLHGYLDVNLKGMICNNL
jgi:hypothetical protein